MWVAIRFAVRLIHHRRDILIDSECHRPDEDSDYIVIAQV
jgi:hypothetical protein